MGNDVEVLLTARDRPCERVVVIDEIADNEFYAEFKVPMLARGLAAEWQQTFMHIDSALESARDYVLTGKQPTGSTTSTNVNWRNEHSR